MKLTLLSDYVIVQAAPVETVTASGIVLPENTENKEKVQQGTVTHVGPGKKNDDGVTQEMEVKKGDVVFFKEDWSAETMKLDGKEYNLIHASDVIAIIE